MNDIVLGIDYGETNTGLAFGRMSNGLTSPLEVLDSRDVESLIAKIGRYVVANRVSKLIVGLPLTLEGKETPQSLKVRRFCKLLKVRLKKPVDYISEHGTTKEAIEGAIKSGFSMKGRKKNDNLSAALILKRYFSENSEQS